MKAILVAVATAVTLMLPTAANAYVEPSRQVQAPTVDVKPTRLTHVRALAHGRVRAAFDNGAVWNLAPCKKPRGHRCFWDGHAPSETNTRALNPRIRLYGQWFYLYDMD